MVLVRRLGGWRPVDSGSGVGRLRLPDGVVVEGVAYDFEVWHQFSGGFEGPYRSEGVVSGLGEAELGNLVGRDLVLELEDRTFLQVRISPGGELVAHHQPAAEDPWPREPE